MKKIFFSIFMAVFPLLFCTEPVALEKIEAMEGTLAKLSKPSGRATHRLVLMVNGKEYLLALAGSTKRDLSLWEKRPVRVEGSKKWLPGARVPYLEIRRIVPVSQLLPWQSSAK